jgi:hypothetical protein
LEEARSEWTSRRHPGQVGEEQNQLLRGTVSQA